MSVDEQAVREKPAYVAECSLAAAAPELCAKALALLDEKDAHLQAKEDGLRVRDSRIAELEAAIAEAWDRAYVEPLRPFVKQPSDPLVEAWKDAWPGTPDENAREEADKLRGVLSRHGLTITEVGPCRIIPSMRTSEHGENETIRQ